MPPSIMKYRYNQIRHAHNLPPSGADFQEIEFTRKDPASRFCLEISDKKFSEEAKRYKGYAFDPDTGLWINKK